MWLNATEAPSVQMLDILTLDLKHRQLCLDAGNRIQQFVLAQCDSWRCRDALHGGSHVSLQPDRDSALKCSSFV